MSAKIIPIGCVTRLDLQPDVVLEAAKGKMQGVVLLGYNNDGKLYFASTYADGGQVLWLLEKCKQALLEITE